MSVDIYNGIGEHRSDEDDLRNMEEVSKGPMLFAVFLLVMVAFVFYIVTVG